METKRNISIILTIIMCLTPFLVTPGFADTFYLIKAIFVIIFTLLIVLKWFLYEQNKKSQVKNSSIITKIALIYLGLIYISTIFSVNILNSIIGISNRWESVIILSCYVLLFVFSSKYFNFDINKMKILVYSGIIMSLIGVLQFFRIIYNNDFPFAWGRFTAAYGTLGNPNYLGAYITMIFPISLYLYFSTNKIGYYLSSCIMYSTLILTMTRGAWLGALSAFMLVNVCFFQDKTKHKKIIILSITLIAITLGIDLLLDGAIILRFLSILFEFGGFISVNGPDEMAGSSRIFTWTRIFHSIPRKPFFGVGVSNLRYIFETYYQSDLITLENIEYVVLDRAHNEFLHIPMTTGIPSLISYVALIGSVYKKTIGRIKKDAKLIALFASILGYTVQSFFSSSIISHSYIFWIFLGACIYQADTE